MLNNLQKMMNDNGHYINNQVRVNGHYINNQVRVIRSLYDTSCVQAMCRQ